MAEDSSSNYTSLAQQFSHLNITVEDQSNVTVEDQLDVTNSGVNVVLGEFANWQPFNNTQENSNEVRCSIIYEKITGLIERPCSRSAILFGNLIIIMFSVQSKGGANRRIVVRAANEVIYVNDRARLFISRPVHSINHLLEKSVGLYNDCLIHRSRAPESTTNFYRQTRYINILWIRGFNFTRCKAAAAPTYDDFLPPSIVERDIPPAQSSSSAMSLRRYGNVTVIHVQSNYPEKIVSRPGIAVIHYWSEIESESISYLSFDMIPISAMLYYPIKTDDARK
ncbi:unnamed protein product [Trichogramma brassicae]|uniref:Uncharacterized protein n=1 Tax=Trichogramma brassicae TaxID=86971 RepID=A0A6H5J3E7_9HYME|nr:unnamed protein product [Trichogramma brassicae]